MVEAAVAAIVVVASLCCSSTSETSSAVGKVAWWGKQQKIKLKATHNTAVENKKNVEFHRN